jgi:hypothetical protein
MPAITRSKTRQLIDKMNSTDPYYSRYLKTVKKSGSVPMVTKFESLLKREQTPDVEELVRTLIDLHQESEMKRSEDNDLHILGNIMFKALSQVRSYLSKCPDPDDSTNDRYKAWLTIYDERCRLVHGGLDQMDAQEMWDALKDIRNEIKSGEAALIDEKLTQFALDAVDEVETHKFEKDGEVIRLRNGKEIVP